MVWKLLAGKGAGRVALEHLAEGGLDGWTIYGGGLEIGSIVDGGQTLGGSHTSRNYHNLLFAFWIFLILFYNGPEWRWSPSLIISLRRVSGRDAYATRMEATV